MGLLDRRWRRGLQLGAWGLEEAPRDWRRRRCRRGDGPRSRRRGGRNGAGGGDRLATFFDLQFVSSLQLDVNLADGGRGRRSDSDWPNRTRRRCRRSPSPAPAAPLRCRRSGPQGARGSEVGGARRPRRPPEAESAASPQTGAPVAPAWAPEGAWGRGWRPPAAGSTDPNRARGRPPPRPPEPMPLRPPVPCRTGCRSAAAAIPTPGRKYRRRPDRPAWHRGAHPGTAGWRRCCGSLGLHPFGLGQLGLGDHGHGQWDPRHRRAARLGRRPPPHRGRREVSAGDSNRPAALTRNGGADARAPGTGRGHGTLGALDFLCRRSGRRLLRRGGRAGGLVVGFRHRHQPRDTAAVSLTARDRPMPIPIFIASPAAKFPSSARPGSNTTIVVEPRWKMPSSSPRRMGFGSS